MKGERDNQGYLPPCFPTTPFQRYRTAAQDIRERSPNNQHLSALWICCHGDVSCNAMKSTSNWAMGNFMLLLWGPSQTPIAPSLRHHVVPPHPFIPPSPSCQATITSPNKYTGWEQGVVLPTQSHCSWGRAAKTGGVSDRAGGACLQGNTHE